MVVTFITLTLCIEQHMSGVQEQSVAKNMRLELDINEHIKLDLHATQTAF